MMFVSTAAIAQVAVEGMWLWLESCSSGMQCTDVESMVV